MEVLLFERHSSIEDSSHLVPESSRCNFAITRSWKGGGPKRMQWLTDYE